MNELKEQDLSSEKNILFFGNRLKRIMILRSVKCRELADQIFSATSTITGYRTGRRSPDLPQLAQLARVLNVSVDYLLGLKDEPEKLFPDQ